MLTPEQRRKIKQMTPEEFASQYPSRIPAEHAACHMGVSTGRFNNLIKLGKLPFDNYGSTGFGERGSYHITPERYLAVRRGDFGFVLGTESAARTR